MGWRVVPRWRGRRYRNRMVHEQERVLGHRVRQPVRALQPDFRGNGPHTPRFAPCNAWFKYASLPPTTPPDLNTLRSPLVCCDA